MIRKALCVALLLPLVVLAAKIGPNEVQRVAYTGENVHPVVSDKPIGRNPRPMEVIGTFDTIGGTKFDIWFNGPMSTLMYYDPNVGIHASWMYSNGNPGTDRNMRYNFYDISLSPPQWAFSSGPDYMLWGVNAHDRRSGFGMLDASDATGCAWISAHISGTAGLQPVAAQDQTPGGGSFINAPGEPNASTFLWPATGLTNSGTFHSAMTLDDGVRNKLYYGKIASWPDWTVPYPLPDPAPDCGFPDYNIATSHISNTVVVMWPHMNANPATEPMTGHLRFSRDDGESWEDPIDIGFPPMFCNGDTQPTWDINSFHGIFDDNDNFHLVGCLQPFLGGFVNWVPSAIWHWDGTNGFSKIVEAYSDTWVNPGSNCTWASRPTITQVSANTFVCTWEMVDSINVEPNTEQNRFRIFASRSDDGGLTWGPAVPIRAGGTSSYRYPGLTRKAVNDTCHLIYLEDLEAGFAVASPPVGTMTPNPVIHHKFWVGDLPSAVSENKSTAPKRVALTVAPNPTRGATSVSYALPKAGTVSLKVYDNTGRPVRTLVAGKTDAGEHKVNWNGLNESGSRLTPGVYFVTLVTEKNRVSRKLTLLQ